jgi:hypothetical protein
MKGRGKKRLRSRKKGNMMKKDDNSGGDEKDEKESYENSRLED